MGYPAALDNLTMVIPGDTITVDWINHLADAIVAVEQALGVLPGAHVVVVTVPRRGQRLLGTAKHRLPRFMRKHSAGQPRRSHHRLSHKAADRPRRREARRCLAG